MDWRPSASLEMLRERARLVRLMREFFDEHGLLEIDAPVLQGGANLDRGVHPLRTETAHGPRWLITSPEHSLKRLVAAGSGDVWSLSPVFRDGELGSRHQPEFRMLEWYRVDQTLPAVVNETLDLFDTVTGWGTVCEQWTYRDAFVRLGGIDPALATDEELQAAVPAGVDAQAQNRDEWLDLILATKIQPQFPGDRWTAITDWPAAQAAQAEIDPSDLDWPIAKRCEIYRGSLELANGYQECTNADEMTGRFLLERKEDERPDNIIEDQAYLAAMQHGLPTCSGMAVGFDRLVMLATGITNIAETLPFPQQS